jgi:hypothetical protein
MPANEYVRLVGSLQRDVNHIAMLAKLRGPTNTVAYCGPRSLADTPTPDVGMHVRRMNERV